MAHARNGCSQSSRFLPQATRIVGSGDENGESVNFTDDEIYLSFVFVTQGLVRNGDIKSMAAMFLVPSEIAQLSSVKRFVNEEPFHIQNQTEIVQKYFHV